MLGNWHVRFGERRAETSRREAAWRCAPTLLLFTGPRPSRPRWLSLARGAIGPQPSGPQRQRRTATSLLFCLPARNAAVSRQGKKAGAAVAGRRSRPWPALGPDQPIWTRATNELTETVMAADTTTAQGLELNRSGTYWRAPETIRTSAPQIRSLIVKPLQPATAVIGPLRRPSCISLITIESARRACPSSILRCDFPPAASTALSRRKFGAKFFENNGHRKRCVLKGLRLGCGARFELATFRL
jgi:hypothetical protein